MNQTNVGLNSYTVEQLQTIGVFGILWFITLGILIIVVICKLAIILKNRNLKFNKGKLELTEDEQSEESITQSLEARDYRSQIEKAALQVKQDIRRRIKANGWHNYSEKEWNEYVTEATFQHDITQSQWLDIHYYPRAKIERTTLVEWNKILWPDIELIYYSLYEKMWKIVQQSYTVIAELDRKLKDLESLKGCEPTAKKCLVLMEGVMLTEKIHKIKTEIVIRCMVDVERALMEIMQKYSDHYIKKYKQVVMNGKE